MSPRPIAKSVSIVSPPVQVDAGIRVEALTLSNSCFEAAASMINWFGMDHTTEIIDKSLL